MINALISFLRSDAGYVFTFTLLGICVVGGCVMTAIEIAGYVADRLFR